MSAPWWPMVEPPAVRPSTKGEFPVEPIELRQHTRLPSGIYPEPSDAEIDAEPFADDPVCSAGVKGCNDWHGPLSPKPSDEEGSRCALCGVPVRYGSRCRAHYGVYPEPTGSEADRG